MLLHKALLEEPVDLLPLQHPPLVISVHLVMLRQHRRCWLLLVAYSS